MKGKILFLSKRKDAASTRYRIFHYFDILKSQGWHCDYEPVNSLGPIGRWQLIRRAKNYSIIVIQRKLFDSLTLSLLRSNNPNIVFDYDDAIFLNDDGSQSPRRLKRFNHVTQIAKMAFAGNNYLARQSQAENTIVVPTTVDLKRYSGDKRNRQRETKDLVLVWIGSKSTQKYLENLRETFEALGKKFPSICLRVISDFQISFQHLATECITWSEAAEVEALRSADIGIAPLTEDPWTEGKCGLKVLQYMACGLPVISSKAGVNKDIVENGKNGYLAEATEDWIFAIDRLSDAAHRKTLGEEGYKKVENTFSVAVQGKVLDNSFTKILTKY